MWLRGIPLSLTFVAAMAFPHETAFVRPIQPSAVVSDAPNPAVTRPPRCTDGSTLLHTTDCTMGTPVSYCHKPESLNCAHGFFPANWHPDHCMEASTCFPLNAAWLTTECSNGALPYTTRTLYDGTLAGGASTVISGK
ncbi:hypothetical protein N7492_000138 [Penicillium capsulatum]|uniref:Uncharacterized protein n=1 Tax=Penicillium capsulatum TaxID=69766 RepID=A0A9W9IR84_9EURO|nr:hypothetical protein N7492_000138 [Penicillium capsulatum]